MKDRIRLALDKSARRIDENGFLHVVMSNISKATVNPYNGEEIADVAPELAIDPRRVYFLLRDPQELARAAGTFNNLPLLDFHEPISADEFDQKREFVVGALGDQARFSSPYLQNSLVVWDAGAIERISTREQVELSCAYRYEIDMTPGTFEGVAYDGVMRNLRGNHVALVEAGRAGPDVLVSDAKPPTEKSPMKKKLNPRAIAVRGALLGHIRPRLAADQALKLSELTPLVALITAGGFKAMKPKLAQDVQKAFKDRLAADANLDDIMDLLDNLEDGEGEEIELEDGKKPPAPPAAVAKDDDMGEDADEAGKQLLALLQAQNLPDDVMTQVAGLLDQLSTPKAVDGNPPKGPEVKPTPANPAIGKPAMDAAIKAAADATVARMTAITLAQDEVEPLLGRVRGHETPEAVYKLALDHAKVDLTGVHPSAYRPLVQMLLQQQSGEEAPPALGMDAKFEDAYEKQFGASRIGRA